MPSTIAMTHEQQADHQRAERVEQRVAGDHREADAEQGEDEAGEGAGVLQQHDRQLGRLGAADERHPGLVPAARTWLLSLTAVRSENDSSTIETTSTAIGSHHHVLSSSCGWISFCTPSYTANRPPTREQDDRDDERGHEPLAAVAERVLAVRASLRLASAEHEQQLVAGVGDRVDRLGEHRRGSGEQPGDDLRERDAQIREERRQDRLIATGCTHASSLCRHAGS